MAYAKGNTSLKSIFISAGEQSGDLHASGLIKELRKNFQANELTIAGLGGDRMRKENANLLYHINELSAIGFVDVLKKYRFFRKVLKTCLDFVRNNDVKVVTLVDYPGFNLRFAEELRKFYTGKIIYYISPQLWAWHEKRVYSVKKNVDKMLVVFPFEVDFYKKFGVDAVFVGHPLVKRIREFLKDNSREKKIFGGEKKLAILPGSRNAEIKNHMPVLLKTAAQLSREFELTVNISKAAGVDGDAFDSFDKELRNYNLTSENSYGLILNSDLVFTKSGTSTLECALIGIPFLIFYRTFPLNYYLLKPVVKIDRLGMVNILSKKMVVKEFIQREFTADNLLLESRRILTDENYKRRMQEKLKQVWNILGEEDASFNAAKIISSYIKE